MKILVCHNYYQQPGGEDQVFADETALLESRGHEVVRYTLHNDALAGMSRPKMLAATLWNRQSYDDLRTLICREHPALMHCHNTFPLVSPSAYEAAGAEGVPVVQSLHNYRLLCPAGLLLRGGKACEECLGRVLAWPGVLHGCYRGSRGATAAVAGMVAFHRLQKTWSRSVARYIAMSEFSRQKFIAGGLPADRLAVKPNFVDPDPGAGAGDGGYAVFVGRLSHEKGVDALLEAWQRLSGAVPLRIVGDGPMAPEVEAAARRDPSIQWLGRLPLAEVLPVVGRAATLLFPSACYENCPKTLIESLAKGTPVVAAAHGAMPEMIEPRRSGLLFVPGNAEDLASKVRQVFGGGKSMRAAARRSYESRYTADVNYELLIDVYRRAMAACPAPASMPRDAALPTGHAEAPS